MNHLTNDEAHELGRQIIEVLTPSLDYSIDKERFNTTYGIKSPAGVARIVLQLFNNLEIKNLTEDCGEV